ncbi:hypothetical protein K431DRAFT_214132 [Polychaeton citri CBS 116435]|uniref:Elongation of fatty acids protein n=1 Tax=Polychaeton citri CBS 116435 TaxID=1314669 RepID=A0A9P4QK15_9PEZI|nr:hypothetical protein K431DRAFT_214132 [Polychaeton citri CBS 116435]
MSGPSVYLRIPPASLFRVPPSPLPKTLPAPPAEWGTLRSPFPVPPGLFNGALKPEVPITFAFCYIVTVWLLNTYNRSQSQGKFDKPWSISKTRVFHWFVVLHNALLTLYSLATFIAMARAITVTMDGALSNSAAWPAQVADALCKMHGPRGLGDAATFNTTINIWEVKNTLIHLDSRSGAPDTTDVGRLWNEGLGFWGWWFYLSKFYEVLDTLVIVAKGKRSATLQTFHHAGAMLCVWAGIRYMSPPIWLFVFINSGIHTMMYTYFTLSALRIRVSQTVKRTLTTLQIVQFLVGASYAALHLFVQYDIPVQTPYQVVSTFQEAISTVSSAAVSVTSAVAAAVESPTVTASIGSMVKKYLLRAIGEEGIAEQVATTQDVSGIHLIPESIKQEIKKVDPRPQYETKWRTDWTRVDCIDTQGEAFAIYLNLFYLFPLTALFGRFFYRAYTTRGRARTARQAGGQAVAAAKDARKDTTGSVEYLGERAEEELRRRSNETAEVINDGDLKDTLEKLRADATESAKEKGRRVSAQVEDFEQRTKRLAAAGVDKVKGSGDRTPVKKSSEQHSPVNGSVRNQDDSDESETETSKSPTSKNTVADTSEKAPAQEPPTPPESAADSPSPSATPEKQTEERHAPTSYAAAVKEPVAEAPDTEGNAEDNSGLGDSSIVDLSSASTGDVKGGSAATDDHGKTTADSE